MSGEMVDIQTASPTPTWQDRRLMVSTQVCCW